ncbi:MAG: hypothetical protein AAF203_04900, partial [Pseudomonadota bacterium]
LPRPARVSGGTGTGSVDGDAANAHQQGRALLRPLEEHPGLGRDRGGLSSANLYEEFGGLEVG